MSDEELDCLEEQSHTAKFRAERNHLCELCGVKHLAIGGRDRDGVFRVLYQAHDDPSQARSKIGRLAWCGLDHRESFCRIFRVVCEVVMVNDRTSETPMLICKRCIGIISKHARVVVAA